MPTTDLRSAAQEALAALSTCRNADYSTGHVIHPSFDEKLVDAACISLARALSTPSAVAAEDARPELTDERIDHIADLVVKGMPEGISGFCKSWGWRQFARAVLADCAGHTTHPAPAVHEPTKCPHDGHCHPGFCPCKDPAPDVADDYAKAVADLAAQQGMTTEQVMRAAIRLYQAERMGSIEVVHKREQKALGPAVAEPTTEALLVRDVASFFDVEPLVICVALRTLGFGEFSINTSVSAGMVRELQKFFEAKPAVAAEAGQGIVGHLGKLDPDEGDAVRLWAEIHLLREMLKGPPGFTSWQDAAVSERMAKNEALRKLATQPAPPSQGQDAARQDATRLRNIAAGLTYNDDPAREAIEKHLLNEIAMRLSTGYYVAAPTQPPAEGG